MRATLHQVVTFSDQVFHGNPAFVLTVPSALDPATAAAACKLIGADVLAVIVGPGDEAPALSFQTAEGLLSRRGGDLWCEVAGDRVSIAGASVTAGEGVLHLPDQV